MGVDGQRHALIALPPVETWYLLYRLGPRAELDNAENLPHRDSISGPPSPQSNAGKPKCQDR